MDTGDKGHWASTRVTGGVTSFPLAQLGPSLVVGRLSFVSLGPILLKKSPLKACEILYVLRCERSAAPSAASPASQRAWPQNKRRRLPPRNPLLADSIGKVHRRADRRISSIVIVVARRLFDIRLPIGLRRLAISKAVLRREVVFPLLG